MTGCLINDSLAAYAMQLLDPDDAARVRSHLQSCDRCRSEVQELTDAVSWLAVLSVGDIEREFPDELSTGRDVVPNDGPAPTPSRSIRRRRRNALLAAAAVALLGAGTAAGLLGSDSSPAARPDVVRAFDAATNVGATLTISPHDASTGLHLTMRGGYPRGICSLVVHARDGRTDTAATWIASVSGAADVSASSPFSAGEISGVDVVTPAGHRLIHFTVPAHRD